MYTYQYGTSQNPQAGGVRAGPPPGVPWNAGPYIDSGRLDWQRQEFRQQPNPAQYYGNGPGWQQPEPPRYAQPQQDIWTQDAWQPPQPHVQQQLPFQQQRPVQQLPVPAPMPQQPVQRPPAPAPAIAHSTGEAELEAIAVYLRDMQFKTKLVGGCDREDVLDKFEELTRLYKSYIGGLKAELEQARALHP